MSDSEHTAANLPGRQLGETLLKSVNSGIDGSELEARIRSGHPALQRYLWDEIVKRLIETLATLDYTDARNERVQQEAQTAANALGPGVTAEPAPTETNPRGDNGNGR